MTSLRMAISEFRRLTAGRMPALAILAITLIPTLYASLYLWANHDPYAKLSSVQAALVVDDVPAQSDQSGEIHAGRDVAHDLREDGSFDWQEVSDAEARQGVQDGTYLFALTIPREFSSALASTADFEPKKAELTLTTNEANNYLSTTIADQVLSKVSGSIAQNVSEQAASAFLLGFSTLHDQLLQAGDGAQQLADGLVDAESGAGQLRDGAGELVSGQQQLLGGQQQLASGIDQAAGGADQLAAGAATLAPGARQVADGNAQIAQIGDEIANASQTANGDLDTIRADIVQQLDAAGISDPQRQQILDTLDGFRQPLDDLNDRVQSTSGQLDQLASGSQQVADGAQRLADGSATLTDGLGTARSGSQQLVSGQQEALSGAQQLQSGAGELADGIGTAQTGAQELADGLADGVSSIPALDEQRRDETAQTIASPIATEDVSQASADSYGAGLAPFFLSIGAWVGAYVMFLLVRPLSNRAIAARQSPLRTALGGWLTPAVIAVVQSVVMLFVVRFAVEIDWVRAGYVSLLLALVSVTFVAIVHTLNAWLGTVGQLLGLVLLVLQLASAGGTFPWQTLPGPLQVVHHVLPMTYAVDGLRHLMYGASLESLPRTVAVLVAYIVGALALTCAAAYRRRIWTVSQIKPEIAL
ncbi:YhgE/Pip domain-containing protein [Aeromicrobium sp. YIM 150415]|uniref:YhgE/Pip domain-containing protein n=1 Tax=Aeromicrobium sp. YIM 150415 TaxID=2803912 RepID=UPI001963C922|nr:YhgE/Pip domain-containing protein [Aeromicrobium sp. YIM 150415]MBM9461991.1 YhgE/Pip domain-containing protein [Aeromicrobium sp. YIM 150415]